MAVAAAAPHATGWDFGPWREVESDFGGWRFLKTKGNPAVSALEDHRIISRKVFVIGIGRTTRVRLEAPALLCRTDSLTPGGKTQVLVPVQSEVGRIAGYTKQCPKGQQHRGKGDLRTKSKFL